MRADNFTIPFIVSSKHVKQDEIVGQPSNADVAVTVLDHFGFDTDAMKKEGLLDIGQDGTGTYKNKLNADIDELRIWDRALTREEVEAAYQSWTR